MNKLLSILLVFAVVFCAMPAFADKGGNGHGKGKYKQDVSYQPVTIHNSDRVIIKEYMTEDYYASCPPGLAKKHNGCLPPGQAKKRYVVGQSLPSYIVWEPVPQPLLVRLEPVPVGYRYVMVDKDVLLISEASKKVIDAITLMSAVGR